MAKYYICLDDTGQPYIAHAAESASAVGGRSKLGRAVSNLRYGASRKAKKYLQKVQDYYGKGKNLYLYTQDQVHAFANRGKKKVKEIAGDAALNARGFARTVKNKAGKVKDRAVEKAKDVALNARGLARTVGYKANQAKNRAVEKAKDIAGYDERKRLIEAEARVKDLKKELDEYRNPHGKFSFQDKAYMARQKAYQDALNESLKASWAYARTPLGKIKPAKISTKTGYTVF